jgi:hypothetical protein
VAWILVPAWYEREIYSPYEYVEARLGVRARQMTSALFTLGAVLAQGARLYLTALVLEVVLHDELAGIAARTHVSSLVLAVAVIGLFAVLWTWIGGMASVVWTDLVLFLVFTAAAVAALWFAVAGLDTGFARWLQVGVDAHKLTFFDFDTSPASKYTFWAAILAASWGGVGAYGMDQLMAQRVFCCGQRARGAQGDRVELGLGAGHRCSWLASAWGSSPGTSATRSRARRSRSTRPTHDRILPIYVLQQVPSPWKGSDRGRHLRRGDQHAGGRVHGALADRAREPLRSVAARHGPELRGAARARGTAVRAALGARAVRERPGHEARAVELRLGPGPGPRHGRLHAGARSWPPSSWPGSRAGPTAAGSVVGAALGGLGLRASWHGSGPELALQLFALVFLGLWLVLRVRPIWPVRALRPALAGQSLGLAGALAGLLWASEHALSSSRPAPIAAPEYALQSLQFPWYVPVGSVVAFVFGHVLARPAVDLEPARADRLAA